MHGTARIRALRLSSPTARRLESAPPEAGRIHSVFQRAVNIARPDGRLLTLHGPGPLLAPFAIALARLPEGLCPGAPARLGGGVLALAGTAVHWRGAALVDTAMPASPDGPGSALSLLPGPPAAASAPGLSSAAGREIRERLARGLGRRDPDLFLGAARALVGLGEGLTPGGDDCLVGVLAVIHRFAGAWLRRHPDIPAGIERAAATGTTAVAREFVSHALAGHFAESLIDLVSAGSPGRAAGAAHRLLRAGATSGADTLLGVRLALTALGAPPA